jgi:hypothetical protein
MVRPDSAPETSTVGSDNPLMGLQGVRSSRNSKRRPDIQANVAVNPKLEKSRMRSTMPTKIFTQPSARVAYDRHPASSAHDNAVTRRYSGYLRQTL